MVRRLGSVLVAVLLATAMVATPLSAPAPARAAVITDIATFDALRTAVLSSEFDPNVTVRLAPNAVIDVAGESIDVAPRGLLRIELNGGSIGNVTWAFRSGSTTIAGPGDLRAEKPSGASEAAIYVATTAAFTLNGVIASLRGGTCGAAIGGGTFIPFQSGSCAESPNLNSGIITILDSTVNATAGDLAAAIGAAQGGTSSTISIIGSAVVASAFRDGAAIGGASGGGVGQIDIVRSVVAASNTFGPAIGGYASTTISISNSTVDASSEGFGTVVIGSDRGGLANTVRVTGSDVTASSNNARAAFGTGDSGGDGSLFEFVDSTITAQGVPLFRATNSHVLVDGSTMSVQGESGTRADESLTTTVKGSSELDYRGSRTASRFVIEPGAQVTLQSDIALALPTTTPANHTNRGTIAGAGTLTTVTGEVSTVVNEGVITAPISPLLVPTVLGPNRYAIAIDERNGSTPESATLVFGPTLESVGRDLPPTPTRDGFIFTGWAAVTPGGSVPITASTPLADVASGENVTLEAQWIPAPLRILISPEVPAGASVTYSVFAGDAEESVDVTDIATVSVDRGDLDTTARTIRYTTAGPANITATVAGESVTETIEVQADGDDIASLSAAPLGTIRAGETVTLDVSFADSFGNVAPLNANNAVVTGPDALSISGFDVTGLAAGTHTITITTHGIPDESGRPFPSTTVDLTVEPAELDTLTVTPTASTVAQGGSVTLDVTGEDAFGNAVDIDPADVVITSDVPTDIVDGLTVTFPTASPHTLTVTVGQVSATVVIEVQAPTPAPTPGTGGDGTGSGSGGSGSDGTGGSGSSGGSGTASPSGSSGDSLATTGAADPLPLAIVAALLVLLGASGRMLARR